jgi:hypothetical protein
MGATQSTSGIKEADGASRPTDTLGKDVDDLKKKFTFVNEERPVLRTLDGEWQVDSL